MGTHQGADIDHDRHQRKAHRQPAVADDMGGLGIVRGHRNDLPDDPEQENEGEKGQDRANGGQQQGQVGQIPVSPGVAHQLPEITVFLQVNTSLRTDDI